MKKIYIIHLNPQSYGFKIKATNAKEAMKIAEERWGKQDYDFDVDDSCFNQTN